MSKKGATSSRFEAAKSGAEEHNRRERYLDYIRRDLSHLNQTWEAPDFVSVEDARKKVADKYYEHHTTNKGTHKNLPSNATPIQETVVVIKQDTTMDELKDYARMIQETWGYRPLAIYTHMDEGHRKAFERGRWVPNLHAHLLFDSTDAHGDSLKPLSERLRELEKNKFEKKEREKAKADPAYTPMAFVPPAEWAEIKPFDYLQDLAAKALHMERGESSGRKGLKALEYKNQEMAKDNELLQQQKAELEENVRVLKELDKTLDDGIAKKKAKKDKLAKQTGLAATLATHLGMEVGEDAAIRKELEEIKAAIPGQIAAARIEGAEEGTRATMDEILTHLPSNAPERKKMRSAGMLGSFLGNLYDAVQHKAHIEKSRSEWRRLALGMWHGAKEAVAVIGYYLRYNHLFPSFSSDEVEVVDKALKNAGSVDDRRKWGKDLMDMAHADYPGYKDDDPQLVRLGREVDDIAQYKHQCQQQEQDQERTKGRTM